MTHLNDAELLKMVQNDQQMAFTILYQRYQPMMLTIARKKLNSLQEAEDIIQEIFTSFWYRRKSIPITIPIQHYLLRAVHIQYAYKCRSNAVAKKYKRHLSYEAQNDHHWFSFLENKELLHQIRLAAAKISAPACRKIFELAYIEDKSCSEIATSLNIQTQVVRNQTSRALKVIREILKQVV